MTKLKTQRKVTLAPRREITPGQPVRVVRMISRLVIGGPALNVCLLNANLDPLRFRSWLLCGEPENGERSYFELASQLGVEPLKVKGFRRGVGLWDASCSVRLERILAGIKPHIIHTHTAKAGALGRSVALLRALATRDRPRLIHTFHGHVFHGYFSPAMTRALIAIERSLARFSDVIVTVSPELRKELTEVYRIAPAEKVRVVPLGFDFDWVGAMPRYRGWLRKRLGIDSSVPLVGVIGRLTPIKNHALALRAFRRFLDESGQDARMVVFGNGELQDGLVGLARTLGIADRVLFHGWELDRARLFCDLDVTCLSSRNEGTPVALIESIAAGVPVVATRVGGVPDVVIDGHDGRLVAPNDEEALALALSQVSEQPAPVPEFRRRAITALYSVRRLVRDMEELYDYVLRPHHAV